MRAEYFRRRVSEKIFHSQRGWSCLMIPSEEHAKKLWDVYGLPERKRRHVTLVAGVAGYLADQLVKLGRFVTLDKRLLTAASLLHDIDKNIPKLPEERHPDTAVRILKEEGMEEVADIVKTHSVHAILDPAITPRTIEEKLLFLADKMVKDAVIGVEARFRQWDEEDVPEPERAILKQAYPKVKELEAEILARIGMDSGDVLSHLRAATAV